MRQQVYLCGHGCMSPHGGYATVPKNSTLNFYSDNLRCIELGFIYHALLQTGTNLRGGEATHTVQAYRTCPDYILSPLEGTNRKEALQAYEWGRRMINDAAFKHKLFSPKESLGGVKLSQILKLHEDMVGKRNIEGFDFHWMACRFFPLKQVGNAPTINQNDPDRRLTREDVFELYLYVL